MKSLTRPQADALAAQLELGFDCGICIACLSLVSMTIDEGDRHAIAGATREMTPILWGEGLAEPAVAAVSHAAKRGVVYASEALVDLELRQGRSVVARAIVARLAADLSRTVETQLHVEERARERPPQTAPELN